MKLDAVVVGVAVLVAVTGCGGTRPSSPPPSVARVKRTFAAAGIPLTKYHSEAVAGGLRSVDGGTHTRPLAVLTSEAAPWVAIYPTTADASLIAADTAAAPLVVLKLVRVSNVLIGYSGREAPMLRTAIRRLG